MLLSKIKIKFLSSLRMKKFRDEYKQYIAEGEKIVRDALKNQHVKISLLAATENWLNANRQLTELVKEVYVAGSEDLQRISTFETPPPVIALIDIPETVPDFDEVEQTLSVGLDTIQDPGNLGTIIRTADWFGIRNIFCSPGCADIYNPKVIHASMGALFNVKVHYTGFYELLKRLAALTEYDIIGTYPEGEHFKAQRPPMKGMLLFGNESRGITGEYTRYITRKISITPVKPDRTHVESLNVASSVAIILEGMTRNE